MSKLNVEAIDATIFSSGAKACARRLAYWPASGSACMSRILIVGAGFGGSTLACALASDDHHVTVVERRRTKARGAIGEHFPPEARQHLVALGLAKALVPGDHVTSPGVLSLWMGEWSEKNYAFSLGGDGLNLDRSRFDRTLRAMCVEVGVAFVEKRVIAVRKQSTIWQVQFSCGAI